MCRVSLDLDHLHISSNGFPAWGRHIPTLSHLIPMIAFESLACRYWFYHNSILTVLHCIFLAWMHFFVDPPSTAYYHPSFILNGTLSHRNHFLITHISWSFILLAFQCIAIIFHYIWNALYSTSAVIQCYFSWHAFQPHTYFPFLRISFRLNHISLIWTMFYSTWLHRTRYCLWRISLHLNRISLHL